MKAALPVLVVLLAAAPAASVLAQTEPEASPRTVQPYLTAGLVEVVGLGSPPAHLGLYLTLSLDVAFVLSDDWQLIPSFGFEFAPENGAWGGVFLLIVDRFLTELGSVVVTLDPQVGIVHDAFPSPTGGFDHAFFLAFGVGVPFITKRFSVIPQLLVNVGLQGEGVSLAPTLLFSVPF